MLDVCLMSFCLDCAFGVHLVDAVVNYPPVYYRIVRSPPFFVFFF